MRKYLAMQPLRALALTLCLAALATPSEAQTCSDGSDGALNVPTGTTAVINTYLPSPSAATTVPAGARTLPVDLAAVVGAPSTISAGDLLLIVQMQGAQIDGGSQTTVGGAYGDGPGGADRQGNLSAGFVAGRYEVARAAGAPMAGSVPLQQPLRNAYLSGAAVIDNGDGTGGGPRRYQVIRVPQYTSGTIGGTLTGVPWNGRAGGVIALDVIGPLTIDDNGVAGTDTIDGRGLGFRGGSPVIPLIDDVQQDGIRGEGIAGTPARTFSQRGLPPVNIGPSRYFAGDSERGGAGNAGGGPLMRR